jgi:hypothetical protein
MLKETVNRKKRRHKEFAHKHGTPLMLVSGQCGRRAGLCDCPCPPV